MTSSSKKTTAFFNSSATSAVDQRNIYSYKGPDDAYVMQMISNISFETLEQADLCSNAIRTFLKAVWSGSETPEQARLAQLEEMFRVMNTKQKYFLLNFRGFDYSKILGLKQQFRSNSAIDIATNLSNHLIADFLNGQKDRLAPIEPSETKETLNNLQKQIIEASINFLFEDISELKPDVAIRVYDAILKHKYYLNAEEENEFKDKVENVRTILGILTHPWPQNRCDSYPYVSQEEGFCMFKMDKSSIKKINSEGDIELKNGRIILKDYIIRNSSNDSYFIAKERTGILGLTSREDENTPPVQKDDVVNYIEKLAKDAKRAYEARMQTNTRGCK